MAVSLAVLGIVSADANVRGFPDVGGGRALDALGVILILGQSLPIAVRLRNPPLVLCVTGVTVTIYSVLGYPGAAAGLGTLVAFYTVAAHTPRRTAAWLAALTALGIFLSLAGFGQHTSLTTPLAVQTISNYVVFTAWIFGDNMRVRRRYTAELEARAAPLEREREERTRLGCRRGARPDRPRAA